MIIYNHEQSLFWMIWNNVCIHNLTIEILFLHQMFLSNPTSYLTVSSKVSVIWLLFFGLLLTDSFYFVLIIQITVTLSHVNHYFPILRMAVMTDMFYFSHRHKCCSVGRCTYAEPTPSGGLGFSPYTSHRWRPNFR